VAVPPPPPGFVVDEPAPRRRGGLIGARNNGADTGYTPTGKAHDGDTFGLPGGVNARLLGVDAFELSQSGLGRAGPVPLGSQARNALLPFVQPSMLPFNSPNVTPTGEQTYGRPVVTLSKGGTDAGAEIIGQGLGLAAPQYLGGTPRLGEYMQAERLARLNRRGAFGMNFQSPDDYRHGVKPGPWNPSQVSLDGKGEAIFWDEPTPFQGLRPELAKEYQGLLLDNRSTARDILGFADRNGLKLDPKDVDRFVAQRSKPGAKVDPTIRFEEAPRILTDPGDGAVGAGARGLADPFNMLDELGGVVDTLGGTKGRENIFNSDRRFGDVLWNNIDQNRSILDYDDAAHPYARFGGQLASGFTIPVVGAEGVGFNAARAGLRAGASRFMQRNGGKVSGY
jgi:endonuclease YncB( thermonuclease family)